MGRLGQRVFADLLRARGRAGSRGIYRAASINIDQIEPLMARKVSLAVVALGGDKGFGAKVGETVRVVASHVEAAVQPDCGHFLPEEAPDAVIKQILAIAARTRS
jgi:pimeloyl-ACP methyl ester carboxylesterase